MPVGRDPQIKSEAAIGDHEPHPVDPKHVGNLVRIADGRHRSMHNRVPVFDEAIAEGRLHGDDLLVLSGFGAGLAWGTAVVRW